MVALTGLGSRVQDRLWSVTAESTAALDSRRPLAGRFIHHWPWPFGQQEHTPIDAALAASATAARFQTAAREEAQRLWYVSMTRARDLLILTHAVKPPGGGWFATLDAPWLWPAETAEALRLPDGQTLAVLNATLAPPATPAARPAPAEALFWFPAAPPAPRLPWACPPSRQAAGPVTVLEQVRIGERLTVADGVDRERLGTALHACLALAFADHPAALTAADLERVLTGHGAGAALAATAVQRQIAALRAWIAERWGEVLAHAEYPVTARLANGQILPGRLDLLLDTAAGRVLIDHKTSPLSEAQWHTLADRHGGQLLAYADAIRLATGQAVHEVWLPVAGGGLRIARPEA